MVPVSWPGDGLDSPDLSDAAGASGSGFGWPSDGFSLVECSAISREAAAEAAGDARREWFGWLCGAGLGPVPMARRWVEGLLALRMDGWAGIHGSLVRGLRDPRGFARMAAGMLARELRMDSGAVGRMLRSGDGVLRKARAEGRYPGLRDDRSARGVLVSWTPDFSGDGGGSDARADEVHEVKLAAVRLLMRWLGQGRDGRLVPVVQRGHSLAFHRYGEISGRLTGEDFACLLGMGRAAFCEQSARFFGEPGEVLLGFRPKVAGQKSAEASEKYAANAAAHCPRRELGGFAGVAREERPGPAKGANGAAAKERAAVLEDWRLAERALESGTDRVVLRTRRQREFFSRLRDRYLRD